MECYDELYFSDEEINPLIHIFYRNGNVSIGTISCTDLINIPCWAYNRRLDTKRVLDIEKSIRQSKFVYGTLSICELDEKYYLIDGQHRQKAIEKLIGKGIKLNECLLYIHKVNNEDDIYNLFKIVNDTKPLDPKETPSIIISKAVDKLAKDYPKAIKSDTNRTCYPYILSKELYERIKDVVLNSNNTEISTSKIYTAIKKINLDYSKMKLKDIPGIKTNLTKAAFDKVNQSGFYLGLDVNWSWISIFEEELNFT